MNVTRAIAFLFAILITSGCATNPSVPKPVLRGETFLDMTNKESAVAIFRLSEKGDVIFDKLSASKPTNLIAIYAKKSKFTSLTQVVKSTM